jgi:FlaA1/EpsC-like NDP-sugar epimerase
MVFQGKKILVTGGTGSLGKVLVRRLLSGKNGKPEKIIILSRDEAKQHNMRLHYLHKKVATDEVIYRNFESVLEFRIGDVRDYGDICSALRDVDVVINAAALKQVPTCEYFPFQAVMTNCFGAMNIVRAISENGYPVELVIGVSTDKACKPVNAMGLTKALQERVFIAANILNPKTRFIGVRYGNVLASRGSVIPLFHDQIKSGGPVTITSEAMTRFLLSLDSAVDTITAAMADAKSGEIFIPRVPAVSVLNIAKALVRDTSIPIKVTGVRPGEKLHEILVSEEEITHCIERGNYYAIAPMLPELISIDENAETVFQREYSSKDNVLNLDQTVALLSSHQLMIEDETCFDDDEFLK